MKGMITKIKPKARRAEGGEETLVETHDWVFVIVLGVAFVLLARPFGRSLANQLEGP